MTLRLVAPPSTADLPPNPPFGYGPHRLVADVIAAAAAHGLCPVFSAHDLDMALEGARSVLAALHLPAGQPDSSDGDSAGRPVSKTSRAVPLTSGFSRHP
jgi:hypothetical protein